LQFDEKEVELLISGTPDIEVEDWRSATEYHGYSASDAVIVWWWRALKSFSRADRAKVLSFATGTAKVPLGGFAELQVRNRTERKARLNPFCRESMGSSVSRSIKTTVSWTDYLKRTRALTRVS
jgi:HECT-domain (ubiquitin-transferase)